MERVITSSEKVCNDGDGDSKMPRTAKETEHSQDVYESSALGRSSWFPDVPFSSVTSGYQQDDHPAPPTTLCTSEDIFPMMISCFRHESPSPPMTSAYCDGNVPDNGNKTVNARSPKGTTPQVVAMSRTVLGARFNDREERVPVGEMLHVPAMGAGACGTEDQGDVSYESRSDVVPTAIMRHTQPSLLGKRQLVSDCAPADVNVLGHARSSAIRDSFVARNVGHGSFEADSPCTTESSNGSSNRSPRFEGARIMMQAGGMSAPIRGAGVETQLTIEELLGISTAGAKACSGESSTAPNPFFENECFNFDPFAVTELYHDVEAVGHIGDEGM